MYAITYGEFAKWPSRHELAAALREAGMRTYVGQYSVRIEDFSCFKFQNYGGDIGPPKLDADADTVEEMLMNAERVSAALARAQFVHRFEVYDEQENLVGYFHYGWPKERIQP